MVNSEECAFRIRRSSKLGRHLVAKKNIKTGELVLKESALILYPRTDEFQENDKTVCISCYRMVEKNKIVECSRCKWPFCSQACSRDSDHRTLECDIFKINNISWTQERIGNLYLVRCLALKKKDRVKWKKIMSLSFTYDIKDWVPPISKCNCLSHNQAKEFLEHCKMKIPESKFKKLVNIFDINCYTFGVQQELESTALTRKYKAVYENGSLFAHSCASNVVPMKLKREGRWTLGFFAQVNIKKGDILTITYDEDFMSCGTQQRRISLYNAFGFICQCARCKDPTEFGTFYSSLKCSQCSEGWLLPPALHSKSRFYCNKCRFSISMDEVKTIENGFKRMLIATTQTTGQFHLNQLDDLISNATTLYGLHQNHYLVIYATKIWLSICDLNNLLGSNPEVSGAYKKIVKRAKGSLAVRRAFGRFSERVHLESIISIAMARFEFKCVHMLPVINDEDDLKCKLRKIRTTVKHLSKLIGSKNSKCDDLEIIAFVEDLESRYRMYPQND